MGQLKSESAMTRRNRSTKRETFARYCQKILKGSFLHRTQTIHFSWSSCLDISTNCNLRDLRSNRSSLIEEVNDRISRIPGMIPDIRIRLQWKSLVQTWLQHDGAWCKVSSDHDGLVAISDRVSSYSGMDGWIAWRKFPTTRKYMCPSNYWPLLLQRRMRRHCRKGLGKQLRQGWRYWRKHKRLFQ